MPKSEYVQPFQILKNEQLSENFFFLEGVSLWYPKLKFLPGQYLMTNFIINENYLRRSYSPFLTNRETIGLLIQRNPNGLFSSKITNSKVNDIIRISGQTGLEKSPPISAEKIIFLLFENGISFALNILSWSKNLVPNQIYWQSDLISGRESDVIKQKLFDGQYFSFFQYDSQLIQKINSQRQEKTVFYLAGNGQKISFYDEILRSLGIQKENIIKEIYYNHKLEPDRDWFVLASDLLGKKL